MRRVLTMRRSPRRCWLSASEEHGLPNRSRAEEPQMRSQSGSTLLTRSQWERLFGGGEENSSSLVVLMVLTPSC